MNESGTRTFKLRQDGREYILSISIINDCVSLSGQENIGKEGNFYEAKFSLKDLCSINRYFLLIPSIQEARNELIKAIEKQKVGIENSNNFLKIIFYMVIGTDKVIVKLPLEKTNNCFKRIKNPEEQEPFTGTIRLTNRGNYPEDEYRINLLEKKNENLKISQYNLQIDIQKLLDISQQLIKETTFLYEENAKLGVRLQQIEKQNYETNIELEALKEEEKALNEENIQLVNYNKDLEKAFSLKKENLKKNFQENIQKRIQKDEKDLGNGPKAISSRFEESKIKTYIPRITAKPISDAYDEGILNNGRPPFYYTEKRITQYLAKNKPNNDKMNLTDININTYNNQKRSSFKSNNNDFSPNNLSYNTYNKVFDNNKINDSDNNNNDYPKDNKRNQKKLKMQTRLPAYERISEKTNDYEEEDKKRKQIINESYNQSQKDVDDLRESETYPSNYEESQVLDIQTELDEDKGLNYIKSEIIQNSLEEEMLLNKINKHGKDIQFNILYKAINDSDRAEIFHEKCDQVKRTLVLIETINGKRFGGYTTQSWEGESINKKDNEAFVFSLDKLQVYNIITDQPAIGCYPAYGPVFLGCQIKVNDNFFVKGGITFKKNTNYATNSDFELNDGIKFYGIKDIEVFEVNLI